VPRVSILIPSFNHAQFLEECLASVRAQSFQDYEIVLVDDRSTDESFELAQRLLPDGKVMLNHENLGTYGTQSQALAMASGDLIAILNSDDVWAGTKLAKQVALLDAHLDYSACVVQGQQIDEKGALGEVQGVDFANLERELLYRNNVLASGVLFRRAGLRFCSDLRYSGDWVALFEASRRGKIGVVDEVLTYWRQHSHNTYRASAAQALEEIRVREALLQAEPVPENLYHLSALYIAFGETKRARTLTTHPLWSKKYARRKFICGLPTAIAHRMLWPNQEMFKGFAEPSPLSFRKLG